LRPENFVRPDGTYGAVDSIFTFTVSGLQFADTQASALTGALSRVAGESVASSPYAITQGTLSANGNYLINFTGNALAIVPATLTMTAQAQAKIYGALDPALTFRQLCAHPRRLNCKQLRDHISRRDADHHSTGSANSFTRAHPGRKHRADLERGEQCCVSGAI